MPRNPRELKRHLATAALALAVVACPFHATAQERGWGALGRTLGQRDEPAVDLIPTSLSGPQAAQRYGQCLNEKAEEFARGEQDAYAVVAAAKGACRRDRDVLYSAAYQDERASKSGHNAALHYSNGVLARYDSDVDSALPGLIMASRKSAQTSSPSSAGRYSKIAQLKSLLDSGALTQLEFDKEKAKILSETDQSTGNR